MNRSHVLCLALGLSAIAATPVNAQPQQKQAEIPFADLGGIRDWKADGNKGLWIEGRNRQWYYAQLMGACPNLPFAERVGFASEPTGEFDHFSSIVVQGDVCNVQSLAKVAPPDGK